MQKFNFCTLQYGLYQRLQLQFYALLMMGAIDARNMQSNLAVNKYLHTVASFWISSTLHSDTRRLFLHVKCKQDVRGNVSCFTANSTDHHQTN